MRHRFAELEALRRGLAKPRSHWLTVWFPPRQLLIRSTGRTAVLPLAPRRQVIVLGLGLLGLTGALAAVLAAPHDHLGTARAALVKPGEVVALNQTIGLVGASGRATGVHLHYEVRLNGRARNPLNFLGASSHVR